MPEKVTIKQIAEKMGVSVGTVHRVIYNKPGVGEKTRQRILKEVKASNYQVDEAASLLKRGVLKVAVILPQPKGEDAFYFRGMWAGIHQAAQALARYRIEFTCVETPHRMDNIAQALKELFDSDVENLDGLITVADDPEASEWVARFSKLGVPVALVSSYEEGSNCLCSIRVNHQLCGQLAADYLATVLGKKKSSIMLLTGHPNIYSNQIYAQAFVEYVEREYPQFNIVKVEGFGREYTFNKCEEVLSSQQIDGIFTCNARNTYFLCELLKTKPELRDILFIGTDVFNELTPYFEEGILDAAVYQYHREQTEKAVSVMQQFLVGNVKPPANLYLPVLLAMKANFKLFSS